MSEIVTIALPFFGLILLGYGAGRLDRIPADGVSGLNFFAFYLALPALFFRLTAETPWREIPGWSFLLVTTFSTYCAFAIAFSFGALISRGNVPDATIQGLVGSYSNIGYLGPGLVLAALGPAAGAPTALLFVFDTVMVFVLVPLMMALGDTERTDFPAIGKAIARNVGLHPLILATLAGLAVASSETELPRPIAGLLGFIGGAAAPCALFLFGLSLARKPLGKIPFDVPVLATIKLVGHPLIVYLLLSWIGGFDPVWVGAAVLLAALPLSGNMLTLARKYDAYTERASTAYLLATLGSLVTLTIAVVLVVRRLLPVNPFQ